MDDKVGEKELKIQLKKLRAALQGSGYYLNPDVDLTKDLMRGLLINEQRYGYRSCPCRLASGTKEEDIDIICPCDYRDADLNEYGTCYCALYVSKAVVRGEKPIGPIPERRAPKNEKEKTLVPSLADGVTTSLPLPVWRCRVCGYLCARDDPPETCPICTAEKERFVRFM
jgi:ferredoxin-thioredoxin reductase catalytic subunit